MLIANRLRFRLTNYKQRFESFFFHPWGTLMSETSNDSFNEFNNPSATIRSMLRIAFPSGTRREGRIDKFKKPNCPIFPQDVFGFCGILLHWSGAYNYICPDSSCFPNSMVRLDVPNADVKKAHELGLKWAKFDFNFIAAGDTAASDAAPSIPQEVQDLWLELMSHADEPLVNRPEDNSMVPAWWQSCYLLTIIGDEACQGVGRFTGEQAQNINRVSWVDSYLILGERITRNKTHEKAGRTIENGIEPAAPLYLAQQQRSICFALSQDVACVQPKSRTPAVGCTLRTFSQHLALLPHRGAINVYWQRPPASNLGSPENADFNILLIPYPYKMNARDFQPAPPGEGDATNQSWGWFHIDQSWLPNESDIPDFIKFVSALITEAQKSGAVHAVIFPEYALNWRVFREVSELIANEFKSVNFLTSGSSSNCRGEDGNFVLSANFYNMRRNGDTHRSYTATSRPKHHRWRLNKSQIETYGLEKSLSPDKVWWERINIPTRELHVNLFMENSTFTTLICEDLARSDPVHEALRNIGPNLVFALLMDGPQIAQRWSARYSTGLSDDPGSSVITFTSRALLHASKQVRDKKASSQKPKKSKPKENHSWSVAIWKDDEGWPEEIICGPNYQATLCRVIGRKVEEISFDGRVHAESWAWRKASTGKEGSNQISIRNEYKDLVKKFGG